MEDASGGTEQEQASQASSEQASDDESRASASEFVEIPDEPEPESDGESDGEIEEALQEERLAEPDKFVQRLKVSELSTMLKRNGLLISGNKAEKQARLVEALQKEKAALLSTLASKPRREEEETAAAAEVEAVAAAMDDQCPQQKGRRTRQRRAQGPAAVQAPE